MWVNEGRGCNAALWTSEGLCSSHRGGGTKSWSGGGDGDVITVVVHGHNGKWRKEGRIKRENWPIKAKLEKGWTVANETETTTRTTDYTKEAINE